MLGLAAVGWVAIQRAAFAQSVNPVYLDDSPVATEALARVGDHLASGNVEEAARVLQIVLDEHAERAVPQAVAAKQTPDPDLAVCARTRVIETLLGNTALLETYRKRETPEAQHRLEQGDESGVERSRLLTPAGFEAALRLAQRHIEAARFEAARLVLDQLDKHPDRTGQAALDAAKLMTLLSRYLPREEITQRAALWQTQAGADALPAGADGGAGAVDWPLAATQRGISPLRTLPTPPSSLQGIVSQPLWTVVLPGEEEQPSDSIPRGLIDDESDPSDRTPPMARRLFALPTVADDLVILNDGLNITAWDRYTLAPRWTIPLPMPATADDEHGPDRPQVFGRWEYGNFGQLEDATTVTVRGPWCAAVGGRALAGVRRGDSRVHFFRIDTGELRWSADITKLDPALAEYSLRGPAIIDEGLVLVAARRAAADQRLLVSLALIALDADDGSLVWTRTVASAGFPFFRQSTDVHAMSLHEGIVYRVDQLGVAGAFEASTGRPLWVRRIPVEAIPMGIAAQAWEVQAPIIDDGGAGSGGGASVVFLAPDHRRVVRLDAQTGAMLGFLASDRLMSPFPSYLIAAGDDGRTLVAIGTDRIASAPLGAFDKEGAKIVLSPPFAAPGVLGRVTTTGSQLFIPTVSGVVISDAANPNNIVGRVDLDLPGNTLALNGQIIVADDARLHTYLVWDQAEQQLTKRIEADAKDASAAVTYAELAYRAGRPERIMPAVNKAISAIDAEPESDRNTLARRRLFEAMHEMLLASLDEPTDGVVTQHGIRDATILAQITTALGRVARTPDERVAQVFAAGRLAEGQDGAAAATAAAMYQGVLDDAALAGATWRGSQLAVRGDLEASRRIQRLIVQFGPAVYDVQSRRADDELAALAAQPTADLAELSRVAARYPLAPAAVRAQLMIARRMSDEHKPQETLTALTAGLNAAQRVQASDTAVIGELAGRLVEMQLSRGQYRSASRVLAAMQSRYPGVSLTGGGEKPVDADAARARINERLAAVERWPRIGPLAISAVQLIEDKSILRPVIRQRTPQTAGAVALVNDTELSLWGTSSLTKAEAESGQKTGVPLEQIWSRPLGETSASIVTIDESSAIIFYFSYPNNARWLERVNFSPAEVAWRAKPFDEVVPEMADAAGKSPANAWGLRPVPGGGMVDGAGPAGEERFILPSTGAAKTLDELLVCMDDGVVVLVERSGKAAAYDTNSGELLWASASMLSRVYDATLGSGRLVLGGVRRTTAGERGAGRDAGGGAASSGGAFDTALVVVDVRTGAIEQRLGEGLGPIHWLDTGVGAMDASGYLVVGHQTGVVCYDLATARANWSIDHARDGHATAAARRLAGEIAINNELAQDEPVNEGVAASTPSFPASNAWVLGETFVMVDAEQRAWAFPLATGPGGERGAMTPLDAPARYFNDTEVGAMLIAGAQGGDAVAAMDGVTTRRESFALTTRHGVLMYGPDNQLLGMDALAGTEVMLQPAPGEDRFVALQTIATTRRSDGLLTFSAHQFRSPTGKALDAAEIVLASRPTQLALLDGLVCLTSAGSTIVIPAPASK